MNDDTALLRRYAETRRDADFAALVDRHLGLVYHAALRQLAGDTHQARDAAQVVFTDLARKAPALAREPFVLAGWLHTATRHSCAQIRRTEHRRRHREDEAARMSPDPADSAAADWTRLQPVLDDALHALSTRDRDAVLWRFFEGRTYVEIGARLALSEDAARRRVDRALEKVRARLSHRGVASTASALGLALGTQAGLAPPAGLAASVTAGALANLAATGGVATGLALTLPAKAALATGGALLAALALGYAVTRPPAPTAANPPPITTAPAAAVPVPLTAADLLGTDYLARLRGASAADFGRLLVELWRLGTPAARTRFREVFDHWCQLDPEAASRWAVVTRNSDIGAPDGQALREQSALAWAARDFDAAYAWTLTQPDEARLRGLTSVLLRHLAKTDPAAAIELARLDMPKTREPMLYVLFDIWARSAPLPALAALENTLEIEASNRIEIANHIHAVWAESDLVSATRHLLSTAGQTQEDRDGITRWYRSLDDHRISMPAVVQATFAWWNDQPTGQTPRKFPTDGTGQALKAWLSNNPAQAFAFVDTITPEPLRQRLLEVMAADSGKRPRERLDPAVAFDLLGRMDDVRRKSWTFSFVEEWVREDPESAFAWSRGQPDEELRIAVQKSSLSAIAAEEPETAVAAWKAAPPDEGLALALAEGWAEKAPADAVAWFFSLYPEPSPGIGIEDILAPWMRKDADAAIAWTEQTSRDRVTKAALNATNRMPPAEGLACLVRLAPDPETRMRFLAHHYGLWLQIDHPAATKFLTETPLLTPEEKTHLLGLAPQE